MKPNAPHSTRSRNLLPPLPDIFAKVGPQVVSPAAELPAAIGNLSHDVERLASTVETLLDRLSPILRPLLDGPDGEDGDKKVYPPQADLTNRIIGLQGRIYHTTALLDEALEALAI